MIPDEAVEAAADIVRSAPWGYITAVEAARQILEAAAPHIRQAFFLEMNLRAVEDELNTPLQFGNANRGDRT